MYKKRTWLVIPLLFFGSVHVIEGSLKETKSRPVERSVSEIKLLEATKSGDLHNVNTALATLDFTDREKEESDNILSALDESLLIACKQGYKTIVRLLINHGANVNVITQQGTPISAAAWGGHADIIELLVEYDGDVNEPQVFLPSEVEDDDSYEEDWANDRNRRQKNLPLMIAAKKGDLEVMKTLINAGASVNVYNIWYSPLKEVVNSAYLLREKDPKASISKHIQMVKLLVRSGADLSLTCCDTGEEECTPLHRAVELCFTDMVKVLLKEGASPNAQKYYYQDHDQYDDIRISVLGTALKKTSGNDGSIEIIKLLLEAGADAQYQLGALRRAMRLPMKYEPIKKTKYLLGLSYLLYPVAKSSHDRVYWALRSLRPLFPPYVVVEILCSERSLLQDVINFFLIELKEGHGNFLVTEMHSDKDLHIRWILFGAVKQELISYLEKNSLNMMDSCWHELDILKTSFYNHRDNVKEPQEAEAIKAHLAMVRANAKTLISQGIQDRCKELESKARAELALKVAVPISGIVPLASASNKRARITSKRRIMII